jgi:hypothetical protein
MMNKVFFILAFCMLVLFSGCERADYNTHDELAPDSPKVVTFNYRIYEAPPKDVLSYFDVEITAEHIYVGDDVYIQFKSGPGFTVDEEPIKFAFEDKTERIKFRITVADLSSPLEIPFSGKIINKAGNEVVFFGSLLINSQQ